MTSSFSVFLSDLNTSVKSEPVSKQYQPTTGPAIFVEDLEIRGLIDDGIDQGILPSNVGEDQETVLRELTYEFFDGLATGSITGVTTWDTFINAYRKYIADSARTNVSTHPLDGQPQTGVAFDTWVKSYRAGVLYDPDALGVTDLGWTTLNVTPANIQAQFLNAFQLFITNSTLIKSNAFQAGSADDGTLTAAEQNADDFEDAWNTFLTRTTVVDDNTNPSGLDLPDYYNTYLTFGLDQGAYFAELTTFYNNSIAANGYFNPSHHYEDWKTQLSGITVADDAAIELRTSIRGLDVINRIIILLIEMIDVLHRVSAAQADRLTFFTRWQTAYTTLISQVPTFREGEAPYPETGEDGTFENALDQEAKNRLYAQANTQSSTTLETIRARRQAVQDDAKALQSAINASQDSANQQTNIATSLLQQMSTILGSIYR